MSIISESLLELLASSIAADATYIGVGTGTPVTELDTLLNAENTRKTATSLVDANVVIEEVYFDTTELNGVAITTVGLFGNAATASLNTGKLRAADNVTLSKTNLESLTLSFEITVGRG